MQEQRLIDTLLKPLATNPAALGLNDDAALIAKPDANMVLTTDTMVAGVHFLPDDPPDLIARKLLRVNISDLAAMGAVPRYYLLNLTLPDTTTDAWLTAFCEGLRHDQAEYGIALLGGDTTATGGPVTLTVTALGHAPHPLHKTGAREGDLLAVAGRGLGDAALGLAVQEGHLATAQADALVQAYRLPRPQPAMAAELAPLLTAATDISDGLALDAERLCRASNCGATLNVGEVPLSASTRAVLEEHPDALMTVLTGGDDYQLLVTLPETHLKKAARVALQHDCALTPIGRITAGNAVTILDAAGKPFTLQRKGYQHFASVSPLPIAS